MYIDYLLIYVYIYMCVCVFSYYSKLFIKLSTCVLIYLFLY